MISLLTAIASIGAPTTDAQSLPVPRLMAHVTDQANLLNEGEITELERMLAAYEDSTSNQFLVLLIPTLAGESLEEYSLSVAETNRIGTAGHDNGLLMLIAVEDRKIRIEVGYGLEGVLPDALTATIRENEITPRFREGDYAGGIREGMRGLMEAAAGEYRAEPSDAADDIESIAPVILILVVVFIVIALIARKGGGGSGRGGRGGGILPWLIASQMMRGGGSRGGSSSGWSGGGWSGGGGGWSGGGGSFGGGGSSGGW